MSVLEAYVTNLGKYNEGKLVGDYLKLPTKQKDVQDLLKQISVDGMRYEEFFITDYKTEIEGLRSHLGEYENLDELNYLASLLEDMDTGEREKFEAAVACGEYTDGLQDLINLAQNLDCYNYYPVTDEAKLGHYLIDELDMMMNIPEPIQPYFDYEAYGRDASINDGGTFTGKGYIENNRDTFTEHYNGRDIPEEYKIFAYPACEKSSILEALRNQQTHDAAPAHREKPKPSREER